MRQVKDTIDALDFLLTLHDTDPSADVRENIVDELESSTIHASIPRSRGVCWSIPISTSRSPRSSCCGRVRDRRWCRCWSGA